MGTMAGKFTAKAKGNGNMMKSSQRGMHRINMQYVTKQHFYGRPYNNIFCGLPFEMNAYISLRERVEATNTLLIAQSAQIEHFVQFLTVYLFIWCFVWTKATDPHHDHIQPHILLDYYYHFFRKHFHTFYSENEMYLLALHKHTRTQRDTDRHTFRSPEHNKIIGYKERERKKSASTEYWNRVYVAWHMRG